MVHRPTVLVVDDEKTTRDFLRAQLEDSGCRVVAASDGNTALELCSHDDIDLILLDRLLPDADGVRLVPELKRISNGVEIIVMTTCSSSKIEEQAIQGGASLFTQKPLDLADLVPLVHETLEGGGSGPATLAAQGQTTVNALLGQSLIVSQLRRLLLKIASSPTSTVLLCGETGTGKDLAARIIHYSSDRRLRPFVNITCSALPGTLMESELFGHEQGAFTDARTAKKGLFERAEGGTIFLDEIGELAPSLQSKLLRVLEDKRFVRVGGMEDVQVDVRVIAATNRDLKAEVKAGRFREDLFFRLRVLELTMPALRDRREDLELLAEHFLKHYAQKFGKQVEGITPQAAELLTAHHWPGNVRELRNLVERAVLLCEGRQLDADDFGSIQRSSNEAETGGQATFELPEDGVDLEKLERNLVVQALLRTDGNQTNAAGLLGLNRDQIRYRIEKFGINSDEVPGLRRRRNSSTRRKPQEGAS